MKRHLHALAVILGPALWVLLAGSALPAQTFSGQAGLLIPPGAPGQTVGITQSPCTVTGVGTLGGCLQIANVTIDINHTWTGDVGILLLAPDGTFLDLTTGNGGAGDNWTNCVFSDQAAVFVTAGAPPYTGTWRPEGRATTLNNPYANVNPLGTFTFANTFDGINADGTWILYINDYVAADVGIINSWSITFTDSGTPPPAFPASISSCPGANGLASFNLTTLNETVNGGSGLPVTYYLNPNATSPIGNPANFLSSVSTTIYAVVMGGCPSAIVPITLTVTPLTLPPSASITLNPSNSCTPVQGSIVFDMGGIPGPLNITYNLNGQTFSGTTNAAGVLTLPYSFTGNLTALLLTVAQPGGCAYGFSPVSGQFVLQPGPTIAFSGPNIFCEGQTLDLASFVSSSGTLTFHSADPPTPANQLSSTVITVQNGVNYYALAESPNGCTVTSFIPLVVNSPATPNLGTATICVGDGAFDLATLEDFNYPDGVWSGAGVVGGAFNPTGLSGPVTLTFDPADNCVLTTTTTVTVVSGGQPNLGTATLCNLDNPLDLTTLQDPNFPNGAWSGPGVTGNTFDPEGLFNTVTLVFTPADDCVETTTTQITVEQPQGPDLGTDQLCDTDPPLDLSTLEDPNFPYSGTWSGNGVSGGFFNPAGLIGPVVMIFSISTNDCASGGLTFIEVSEAPQLSLTSATLCENEGLYDLAQLEDPNFFNGSWSGPGVSGDNFNPQGLVGVNTLFFTPNAPCAVPVATTVTVTPASGAPSLETASLCATDAPLDLATLEDPSFPDGVWSGPGVVGNTFNPANFSGPVALVFTPNQNCVSPAVTEVLVTASVEPVLGTAELCATDAPLALENLQDPAFPSGAWSGPGVSGAFFDPTNFAGPVALVFTPAGVNCGQAAITVVEVTPLLAPSLGQAALCENEGLYNLNQLLDPAFPQGIWSGPGVLGNTFDPEGLTGANTLVFTPVSACSAPATTTLFVAEATTPDLGTATVCSVGAPLNLTGLQDPNFSSGQWSGPGVSGNIFNPAGLSGTAVLTFTPADPCATPSTTSIAITTPQAPNLGTATLCQNSGFLDLATLVPTGAGAGVWSGPGVTNNQFDPSALSGAVSLSFTPAGACVLPANTQVTVNASAPPSFSTQFSGDICTDDCLQAAPTLTGEGPFNLVFEITGPNGSAQDTLTITSSGATIAICPSDYALGIGAYTLAALQIADANCQQPLDLSLGAFELVAPGSTLTASLCSGESLTIGNQTFNAANPTGTAVLPGAAISGCDSLVQVALSFLAIPTTQLNQTLCTGASLTVGGQTFNEANPSGSVLFAGGAVSGCDSIVNVALTFQSAVTSQLNQTLCAGASLTVGGQTFNEANPSGSVLFAGGAVSGCDSIVNVALTFQSAVTSQLNQTLCTGASLTVGGQTFNEANPSGSVLFAGGAASGCDSIVNVALTFQSAITSQLNQTLCAGASLTVGGQTFNEANPSGSVLFAGGAVSGCDSIVNVALTFQDPVTTPLSATLCEGESYAFNGAVLTAAGTYTATLTSALGCDSLVTLSLAFAQAPQIVMDSLFEISPRQSVNLQPQVSGSASCTWLPASLVICSTCCETRTVSISRDTVVALYVADENGCEAAVPVTIRVRERPGFYTPNVFRPGSPNNGYFTLYGNEAIEEIELLRVFTRWGESVFERTSFQPDIPQFGWDGTFRGEVLNPGVFVWYARLRLRSGEVIIERGDVTLLR